VRWCRRYHRIVCHNTQLRAGHEHQDPTTLAENSLSDGVVTLPWKDRKRRRLTKSQAAATTSCHALMAAVRSVRCVWAEVRLIFESWKYEPIVSTRQSPLRKRRDATLRFHKRIWPACRPEADFLLDGTRQRHDGDELETDFACTVQFSLSSVCRAIAATKCAPLRAGSRRRHGAASRAPCSPSPDAPRARLRGRQSRPPCRPPGQRVASPAVSDRRP
jgi:hypothetical protein